MKPVDLLKQNYPPVILIWGAAGTSKTALVSQLVNGYLMDFDRGMRTTISLKDKFHALRQNIEFDTFIDTDPNNPQAFILARNKLLDIAKKIQLKQWPYQAIAIDSLTGLCKAAQHWVMSTIAPDKHSNPDAFGVPQLKHFNHTITAVNSMLQILRSIGVLTIVTAHEAILETNDDVMILIKSATKNHGANEIPWQFDELWHSKKMPVGQGKISYIVGGSGSVAITTRTRSGLDIEVVHNEIGLVGILKKINYVQAEAMKKNK